MDGMSVYYHEVNAFGDGDVGISHTINFPAPTSVIAEMHLSSLDTRVLPTWKMTAFAAFVACTTDGSPPPPAESLYPTPVVSVN